MCLLNNLNISYSSITKQAFAGIIAGLTAALLLKFIGWIFKPRIKLYFDEKDTFNVVPNQHRIPTLFTQLSVKNERRAMATGCKVFVLKIEKKSNEKFENIPMNVHYTLKWANENEPKGYEGLEIPGNYRRRIDLASAHHKSNSTFSLFVEGGLRGISNWFSNGVYRFTIQATGINTNTITKRFIFKWDGTFVKKNISIEEEDIFKKIWFKVFNFLNF